MRCNNSSIGECNTILICIVQELRIVWLSDVTNCLYKINSMNCFMYFTSLMHLTERTLSVENECKRSMCRISLCTGQFEICMFGMLKNLKCIVLLINNSTMH